MCFLFPCLLLNTFWVLVRNLIKIERVISQEEAWGHVAVTQSRVQTDTVGRHYKQRQALWEHNSYTIQLLSGSRGVCYVFYCVHSYINYPHNIKKTAHLRCHRVFHLYRTPSITSSEKAFMFQYKMLSIMIFSEPAGVKRQQMKKAVEEQHCV